MLCYPNPNFNKFLMSCYVECEMMPTSPFVNKPKGCVIKHDPSNGKQCGLCKNVGPNDFVQKGVFDTMDKCMAAKNANPTMCAKYSSYCVSQTYNYADELCCDSSSQF